MSDSIPLCPLCRKAEQITFAFRRSGNAIYRCGDCKLEFMYPQPDDDRLAAIYSSTYFLGAEDEDAARKIADLKRATARLYLDAINRFVSIPDPRLLELGCGFGDFLVEARARGFQVEGLEYSTHSTRVANARLGSDVVRSGSLESASSPGDAYDIIAAFDVIEHVRDPVDSLHRVYSALKSGGIVAIVTPSLDSWSRRLLGRHWMEYKTEHLTYFSRKSLERLLKNAGFTAIDFLPNYKVLSLDYIARHFDRFPVPFFTPALALIRGLLPAELAHKKIRIVASGIMAIARKEN